MTMDYIPKLEELKNKFTDLQFREEAEKSTLLQKLRIYIERLFGRSSSYIDDLEQISFFRMYSKTQSDSMEAWESGKKRCVGLIDNMIEDLTVFTQTPVSQNQYISQPTKVFIVHGHDDLAKTEVARFIEKLGLEAVILHERPNLGATIIEKIERETDVGFGIVLYTPCDVGNSREKSNELNVRARQNVIFEHGYLVSKLRREKVVALVKGSVEKPSDIDGVVYEEMDSAGAWQYKIVREMQAVGYDIDLNKVG